MATDNTTNTGNSTSNTTNTSNSTSNTTNTAASASTASSKEDLIYNVFALDADTEDTRFNGFADAWETLCKSVREYGTSGCTGAFPDNFGFATPNDQYQLKDFSSNVIGVGNTSDGWNDISTNITTSSQSTTTSGQSTTTSDQSTTTSDTNNQTTSATQQPAEGNNNKPKDDTKKNADQSEQLKKAYDEARKKYLTEVMGKDSDLKNIDFDTGFDNALDQALEDNKNDTNNVLKKDKYLRHKFGIDLYSLKQLLIAAEEI